MSPAASAPAPEALSIPGPAGALEALVELPSESPLGFAVVCHPHPLYGGTMLNKVVHTVTRALLEFDIATVRFNFRGVGASAGSYDAGRGELQDALAVIDYGRARWPRLPLSLAGFSFGAQVALLAAQASSPARLIIVAPPVSQPELAAAAPPGCSWLIVYAEADELFGPRAVEQFAARFSPRPQLRLLPGASHQFHGHLHELHEAVTGFLKAETRNAEAR